MHGTLIIAAAFLCNAAVASKKPVGFRECLLMSQSPSVSYCLGYGTLSQLRSFEDAPEFDLVDGLTFKRDEKSFREGGFSVLEEGNPNDFRSVVDSIGQVFARRSMQWDMGFIHPGLSLRVAPSGLAGGVLEFAMDPLQEAAFSQHALKEASTGQIMARQFVVPLLLGLKFNIATLLPIFFGLIALLAKKAIVLSKLALVATSAYGLGALLFSGGHGGHGGIGYPPVGGGFGSGGFHGGSGGFQGGFGGGQHHPYAHYRYPEGEYPAPSDDTTYRANHIANDQTGSAQEYSEDQFRLYDSELQKAFENSKSGSKDKEEERGARNFAWSDSDKKNNNKSNRN